LTPGGEGLWDRRLTIEESIMLEEFATKQSTQETGEEKAGLDETQTRRPEPGWQRIFADLCAEITWGSDLASETVQHLLQQCTEVLQAFTRDDGCATGGCATRTKCE
jgi:hypothetical protein